MHRVGMILITAMLVMMLFAPAASAETTHLYYDSDSGTPISASITTNVNLESTYSSNQRYYTLLSTSDNEGSTRTRWRNFNTGPMNPVLTLVNSTAYSQDTLITGISGKFRVRGSSSVPAFYVRIIDFSDSGEVVLGIAGPLYGSSTSNDAILTFDLSSITGTIPAGNKLGMQVIVDNGGTNWRFYGNAGSTGTTMDFYVEETPVVKGPSVSVTLTPSAQSVDPGNQVQYTVTVDNTGDVSDTFSLSLDNANTADFSYSLASSTTGSLAPAGQYVTTMTVTVAGGATRGNSHGQIVSATGSSSSGASDSVTTSVATLETTYRFLPSNSVAIASGITTNYGACGANTASPSITELTTASTSGCAASSATGGAEAFIDMYSNTAYTSDTIVTGVTYYGRIAQGGSTSTDYTFNLIYAYETNGTVVVLPGSGTQTVGSNVDADYTISLSGITGTVPAGAKLGIRISKDQTYISRILWFGDTASTTNQPSGYFSVTETPIVTPTYNVTVTPSPTSAGVIAGDSAAYTITVNNNGNTAGNYNLGVSDTNGADFHISTVGTSSLAVSAGGSAQTTLTVAANGDASAGASDVTTVTAICVEDGAYTGSGQVITTVQDTTAPVITLLGNASETVEVGSVYTDAGATVSDNYDTGLTATMTGSVDTATVGIYTLIYNAADNSGNPATPVTRTVNVVDTQVPVIALLGNNPETLEVGSIYTDAGVIVTDNYDTGLTATMTGAVDNTTVGIYTLTYNALDNSGNPATPVTRTVNVTDTQVPVITLLGNNPETITVGSIYTDAGVTVTDNYDTGLTATMTGAVDNTTVGIYTLTYNAVDSSGNPATPVTRTVNVVDVVDTEIPVITLLGNAFETLEVGSIYTDAGVTVTDNYDIGLIATMTGSVDNTTVGSYELTYNVNDSSNNAAIEVTRTVNVIDTQVPVITLLGTTPISIQVGSIYIDAGFIVSDNYDTSLTATMTGSVDNTTVGNYPLTYNAVDSSGNSATPVTRMVVVVPATTSGYVNGIVRDSDTGIGIAGAIVTTNTSITKTTDANGFYSMLLDVGTYNLTVIRDPVYYSNISVTIDMSVPPLVQDIVLTLKPTGSITGIVTY